MRKKKSITQMPGDSKRQRADTNLTRAEENRLARQAEEERKKKIQESRPGAPRTPIERGLKKGMQKLKKAVGLKDGGKVKKMKSGGALKTVPAGNKGLPKLPTGVRNNMGYMKSGGKVKKMGMGGKCRGLGAATQGGNFGRMG